MNLSLYIHFPWCVRKCPYCDFNSHAAGDVLPEAEYIEVLLRDLKRDLLLVQGRSLHSIFLGGGTPSLFSPESLNRLFQQIRELIDWPAEIEVTLEANPGAIERGQFQAYREIGINRISLGVQSLNSRHLKVLGRIHQVDEVIQAASEIRAAGFTQFNMDLMHGLPDQSAEEALSDLAKAIDLKPSHLSWYQLTLEPNTVFYTKPPRLPTESTLEDIELQGLSFLQAAGFHRYETSAYALSPEYQCQHNLNYWRFGDYLGIGAGASGKLTDLETGRIQRIIKKKMPKAYLAAADFVAQRTEVAQVDLPAEFMMNALRLTEGFTIGLYEQATRLSFGNLSAWLEDAKRKELLIQEGEWIRPTLRGQQFLNELILGLMPNCAPK